MKKYCFFLMSIFMLSCSDDDTPVKDVEEPDEPNVEVVYEPFKANRMLIKHGLQLQCWVATDNFELGGKAGQPAYEMLPSDWALTGFTGPTFFGPPLINPSYFKSFPESQWAIAKAPHGDHLKNAPTDYEEKNGFLAEDQLKYLEQLTTICFGDEEAYSFEMAKILKQWYDVARRLYPDALLHNNQYPGQWSRNDLLTYIKLAKPDLLTYDWYYFHTWDADNYIGAKDMAGHLSEYRSLALGGWDGKGEDYMAFGQYIQGFVNEGTYKLTESQLRLYYYMTWTFGGKWVNWFRYLQGDGYGGQTAPTEWALLLENGMPGHPTKYMEWANQCNTESKYIGDYLVRLKTVDVRFVAGTEKYTEGKPEQMAALNPSDSFLKSVSGKIVSEPEEGADLYIGFFDVIPKEEQGDPGFFKENEQKFFMITNGYASKLVDEADELTQSVRLGVDLSETDASGCWWINPKTGQKEPLEIVGKEENTTYFHVDLQGGSGALFILD